MTTRDDDLTDLLAESDLDEDPRTDIEALCLCALLWASTPTAVAVTGLLEPRDFHNPIHGDLLALLATQVRAGRLHDPASIAAVLTDTGQAAGHHGDQLTRVLARSTAAGAAPEAAGHYALAVATAAYRRGFHAAAAALTQGAEQLPTHDLFDHLVTIGRERRTAATRLQQLRDALDPSQRPSVTPAAPPTLRAVLTRSAS
jgi:replicative DNA helicase